MPFELGALYTRNAIHAVQGGSIQRYLPTVNGRVVCGCFDPSLNLRAPREIDIGAGPVVQECAERLISSGSTIPVFLKQQTNEWRYIGDFRALRLSREAEDLQGVGWAARRCRRSSFP